MALKRVFVGIRIDADLQPDLQEVYRKLKIGADRKEMSFKWSPPPNWHVTLKFLGPIEVFSLERMQNRLQEAAARAEIFDVRAGGIGAFPEETHARVVWAGVARTRALLDLQSTIDDVYAADGFAPEGADFHPHITLGRMRSAGSVSDLISPFVRRKFSDLQVRELVLFESIQQGPFPFYRPLFVAPLRPAFETQG